MQDIVYKLLPKVERGWFTELLILIIITYHASDVTAVLPGLLTVYAASITRIQTHGMKQEREP